MKEIQVESIETPEEEAVKVEDEEEVVNTNPVNSNAIRQCSDHCVILT